MKICYFFFLKKDSNIIVWERAAYSNHVHPVASYIMMELTEDYAFNLKSITNDKFTNVSTWKKLAGNKVVMCPQCDRVI